MITSGDKMKIDVNRLCRLAGLKKNNTYSSRLVNEGVHYENQEMSEMEEMDHDMDQEMSEMEEMDQEMSEMEEMEEMDHDMSEMEEMIEVDEKMLVQELRRAKNLMKESAQRKQRMQSLKRSKKRKLVENELKGIIESEVANVIRSLKMSGDWVYGNNKPQRSKKGYTHQGSFLKGMGFK